MFRIVCLLWAVLALGACVPMRPDAGRQPSAAADAYTEGKRLYDAGDLSGAEKVLRQAVALNASNAPAHALLGKIDAQTDRPRDAITEWEGVANLDPSNAQPYVELARLYQGQGMFEQALAAALEAIRLRPGEERLYKLLGGVYLDKGDYDAAIRNYERVLEMRPDSAWVYNNLGLAYLQSGRLDDAERQLKKAVASDPANAVAHNNLGALWMRRGAWKDALAEFRRAIELDPTYQKAAQNAADTEALLKKNPGSKKRAKGPATRAK